MVALTFNVSSVSSRSDWYTNKFQGSQDGYTEKQRKPHGIFKNEVKCYTEEDLNKLALGKTVSLFIYYHTLREMVS